MLIEHRESHPASPNRVRRADGGFVATSAIVRINGVVHINSELPPGRVVPEGWTAIGRHAEVVPPGQDERMLFSLYGMNFTKAVFGESRAEIGLKNYLDLFDDHRSDRPRV